MHSSHVTSDQTNKDAVNLETAKQLELKRVQEAADKAAKEIESTVEFP